MEIAREVFSVVLVFALLGGALWALRKAGPVSFLDRFRGERGRRSGGRAKSLQCLERLPLSPQHSLHLIEMDGRRLLVAVHPHGCTLIRGNGGENGGGTGA